MSKKIRLNNLAPVARACKLGYMLDALCGIARGEEVMTSQVTLSIGTSAPAKVKVSAVTGYVNGVWFTANAQEVAFTATGHDVLDTKWATYRISIVANGTVTITMSASVYSTRALAVAALAAVPAAEVDLGYVIVHANGALFDASTTSLAATTVAVEYVAATCYTVDLD
jgi:hypothetical protein